MDDDEIKRILTTLSGEDDKVNISAARAARINELDEKLMNKDVKGKSVKEILEDESNKEEIKTTVNVSSPNTEEWSIRILSISLGIFLSALDLYLLEILRLLIILHQRIILNYMM